MKTASCLNNYSTNPSVSYRMKEVFSISILLLGCSHPFPSQQKKSGSVTATLPQMHDFSISSINDGLFLTRSIRIPLSKASVIVFSPFRQTSAPKNLAGCLNRTAIRQIPQNHLTRYGGSQTHSLDAVISYSTKPE